MAATTRPRTGGLSGPTIQVDPLFPYYANRSPDSVAEEIRLAGFPVVRYFVVNERKVNRKLIEAFRKRGMFVWALVLGNGSFSTEGYPDEWPDWQMKLLRPVDDGYRRFSYFNDDFVAWKTKTITAMLADCPFDGIEIAEPYFPEWNGLESGVYGDVGPYAQRAFRRRYGLEMPEFVRTSSPRYYKNDPDTYRKWVRFRIDAVNGFLDRVINGEGGARRTRPDIAVATWSLAVDAGPDSVSRLADMQGNDAASMIAAVKPDLHVLQTHWPDWGNPDLPADYVRRYEPFVRDIRRRHPDVPIAVQADVGSSRNMIRSRAWTETFAATAAASGYASWTAYEYHIGGAMYEERPTPVLASRTGAREAMISFNKRIRIDPVRLSRELIGFRADGGAHRFAPIDKARVDGSRLYVASDRFPPGSFELRIPGGIRDTPELWLYKDFPANEAAPGASIRVPPWEGERPPPRFR
ncbi:N-acyl-D-glucosamine 2-epimerase [Paenibacillus flagellatus]|uniref:N-acyl-D-glucosamine 2-epimerase n=1 Tax=Paenibacillus flagellatus TaxID=2211139 RepID=A0A2V5K7M5_9BACL|nr:N-acyl-D-glucosamine 2-epimerase [Paenibacillus flagellatus]PYI53813.1 N-acyl-D-glucosamine 2-epimerase [Paenibacillus flagellatus]